MFSILISALPPLPRVLGACFTRSIPPEHCVIKTWQSPASWYLRHGMSDFSRRHFARSKNAFSDEESDLPPPHLVLRHVVFLFMLMAFSQWRLTLPITFHAWGQTPITDKFLVEDCIRRDQRAILNPSKDPNKFLYWDEVSDKNDVSFLKNYVSLEISGSELADLSFVDLPGLIVSVGRGSDE